MNRTCIAFSSKNRLELSKQSIEPLLQADKFDLLIVDGSTNEDAKQFPLDIARSNEHVAVHTNIRGGSGAAIVYALTWMLNKKDFATGEYKYNFIGLVENDVTLPLDWHDRTMFLFQQGRADGLKVGAVTARTYIDRILIQRQEYAVLHNAGAGMIIFTREAAQLILDTYRTQWTTDNRRIFATLAGKDIGAYWAFRGNENFLCADWRWDAVLAQHGYATLGLTPSHVEMIGQVPPLADQGLEIADALQTDHMDPDAFKRYRDLLDRVRDGDLVLSDCLFYREPAGPVTIFAHQISAIGGKYSGNWTLRDSIGYGPFGWTSQTSLQDEECSTQQVGEPSAIDIPVLGPCEILLSGGKKGGQARIEDIESGFVASPLMPDETTYNQVMSVQVSGNVVYRTIRIQMLTPGITFYGIRCRDEQPRIGEFKFDYGVLPKP